MEKILVKFLMNFIIYSFLMFLKMILGRHIRFMENDLFGSVDKATNYTANTIRESMDKMR